MEIGLGDNSRALEMLEQLGGQPPGRHRHFRRQHAGYILAAANEKVPATSRCYASFATLRHQFYQYRLCHCLYHYIPGMVAAGTSRPASRPPYRAASVTAG